MGPYQDKTSIYQPPVPAWQIKQCSTWFHTKLTVVYPFTDDAKTTNVSWQFNFLDFSYDKGNNYNKKLMIYH